MKPLFALSGYPKYPKSMITRDAFRDGCTATAIIQLREGVLLVGTTHGLMLHDLKGGRSKWLKPKWR